MSVAAVLTLTGIALAILSGILRWWVWKQAKKSGGLEEKLRGKTHQETLYREIHDMARQEDERLLKELANHPDDGRDPDRIDEPWLRDRS